MSALTKGRNTPRLQGDIYQYAVAAATLIYAGALVALNAAGEAVPGSTSTTLTAVGRAEATVDNTAGAAGDETVKCHKGVFRFANSGGDPIGAADVGGDCYIADDQTVARTDGTATRSIAGRIMMIDALGVWVKLD